MRICSIVAVVLALSILPSCDGGGDGGGGGWPFGPTNVELGEDSAQFNTFNETQAVEICESIGTQMVAAYDVDATKHGSCLLGGLLVKALMGDAQGCQTSYDACMTAEPDPDEPDDPEEPEDDCAGIYEKVKDCDATIGELEACIGAQIDAQKAFYDSLGDFDCSSEMTDFEAIMSEDSGEPAVCTTLYEKCPGLKEE
jgi:hypothetical protein